MVCGLRGLGHGGNECAIKLLSASVKLGISLSLTHTIALLWTFGSLCLYEMMDKLSVLYSANIIWTFFNGYKL